MEKKVRGYRRSSSSVPLDRIRSARANPEKTNGGVSSSRVFPRTTTSGKRAVNSTESGLDVSLKSTGSISNVSSSAPGYEERTSPSNVRRRSRGVFFAKLPRKRSFAPPNVAFVSMTADPSCSTAPRVTALNAFSSAGLTGITASGYPSGWATRYEQFIR